MADLCRALDHVRQQRAVEAHAVQTCGEGSAVSFQPSSPSLTTGGRPKRVSLRAPRRDKYDIHGCTSLLYFTSLLCQGLLPMDTKIAGRTARRGPLRRGPPLRMPRLFPTWCHRNRRNSVEVGGSEKKSAANQPPFLRVACDGSNQSPSVGRRRTPCTLSRSGTTQVIPGVLLFPFNSTL